MESADLYTAVLLVSGGVVLAARAIARKIFRARSRRAEMILMDLDLPQRLFEKRGFSRIRIRRNFRKDTVVFDWESGVRATCRFPSVPHEYIEHQREYNIAYILAAHFQPTEWRVDAGQIVVTISSRAQFWAALKTGLNHIGAFSCSELDVRCEV